MIYVKKQSHGNNVFDYHEAFSRNIGWVRPVEQEVLRRKRVAIAGMGGVGGSHLLTLTRLGIGSFHVADFDVFAQVNFNRQAGASMASVGKPKVDVMAEMARSINPEIELVKFPEGVTDQNLDEFLDDVDVYVDGLDFFAFDARKTMFSACHRRHIPVVTAAPIGMGAAVLNFLPFEMSADDYFGWDGCSEEEMGLRFLLGLAPAGLHRGYLVDPASIDLQARKGPSTAMACDICAGVAGAQVLKILLRRGDVLPAPYGLQFDAYLNRLVTTWRPGGHRNPLQRLSFYLARRHFLRIARSKGEDA